MSIVKEFREFAVKGNAVDLAVGVIIGAAFGKIVASLVSDIAMPLVGTLLGGLQTCVDFVIIAWSIFLAVKLINRFKRGEEEKREEKPAAPPRQEKLLEEIRDLLKEKR